MGPPREKSTRMRVWQRNSPDGFDKVLNAEIKRYVDGMRRQQGGELELSWLWRLFSEIRRVEDLDFRRAKVRS